MDCTNTPFRVEGEHDLTSNIPTHRNKEHSLDEGDVYDFAVGSQSGQVQIVREEGGTSTSVHTEHANSSADC
jgi:hypothetical protein